MLRALAVFALCAVSLVAGGPTGPNLIINPGFETGSLPPWTTTTPSKVSVVQSSRAPGTTCKLMPHSGSHFAVLSGTAKSPSELSQIVHHLDDAHVYTFGFQFSTNVPNADCTVEAGFVHFNYGPPRKIQHSNENFGCHYGTASGNSVVLTSPPGISKATFKATFACSTPSGKPTFALDDVFLYEGAAIQGDPVFTGFQGQFFRVKGVPGRIFNIISTPQVQFNTRFTTVNAGDSMTSAEMKQARMLREVQLGLAATAAIPRTTAWNHNGTYMGECGVKLNGARLYIAPGPYLDGFSSVTLNGVALPVSAERINVGSDVFVTRLQHEVQIVSPIVGFSLVNSDRFINVEQAAVLQPFSSELAIDGMLGQTANPEWKVERSAHWRRELEEAHLLAGDDLFGDDFSRSQYKGQ